MKHDLAHPPVARSWRDIPQPVKARQMSRSGRWRRIARGLRVGTALMAVAGAAWGGWQIWAALGENPKAMPATVRAVPVKPPELTTDGALPREWLAQTLALPRHASLMELDLEALCERLRSDGQVLTAKLTRRFPDGLVAQITERTPISRVNAELDGERRTLLVARDGTVFFGAGYDAAMLETLPWLDGMAIVRKAQRFLPVRGMELVDELLMKARLEADHLYGTWQVVSLARLDSDGEIEVRTKGPRPQTIVFNAHPKEARVEREMRFVQQLARLDYLLEWCAERGVYVRDLNLTFGREVPVRFEEAGVPEVPAAPAAIPAPTAALPVFSIMPLSPFRTKS